MRISLRKPDLFNTPTSDQTYRSGAKSDIRTPLLSGKLSSIPEHSVATQSTQPPNPGADKVLSIVVLDATKNNTIGANTIFYDLNRPCRATRKSDSIDGKKVFATVNLVSRHADVIVNSDRHSGLMSLSFVEVKSELKEDEDKKYSPYDNSRINEYITYFAEALYHINSAKYILLAKKRAKDILVFHDVHPDLITAEKSEKHGVFSDLFPCG